MKSLLVKKFESWQFHVHFIVSAKCPNNVEKRTEICYDGTQTSHPPQWNTSGGKGKRRATKPLPSAVVPVIKRPRTSNVSSQRLMDSFNQSMRHYISKKVRLAIGKNKKLTDLKKKMLEAKRLPPGILSEAEKIWNCSQNELATYLEHHGTKRNVQYWNDYVQEQFDGVISNLTLPSASAIATIL